MMCVLDEAILNENTQHTFILKVDSCPNDGIQFKNTFVFFCIAFKNFNFQNLLLPRKPPKYAENCRFLSLIFFHKQVLEFLFLK